MRVGVLTSGGDAPGMNAAIRAVVRSSVNKGWSVYGVHSGFEGLMHSNYVHLGTRDVSNIIGRGGTILGSSRSGSFMTESGRMEAIRSLQMENIDALIVIGGNGTQKGACALSDMGFPVVGIASTIDNDLFGSDVSIGCDTALNVCVEAIDRIKVTASSHQRVFVIEVMGRDCGYIAMMAGIAGGAEVVIIPEMEFPIEKIIMEIKAAYKKGKPHAIIVVAEGAKLNASALMIYFTENQLSLGYELRATVLGYVQRGAVPTVFDRVLATRLGIASVDSIQHNEFGVMVGLSGSEIVTTPLRQIAEKKKEFDAQLVSRAEILA
jgi:6-phosphofructokinase 1